MGDLLGHPSGTDLNKMRFFAFLAFVAASIESSRGLGGMSGSSPWRPGTEYTYHYEGRLLTGIPELSAHHLSGIGIRSKLTLTVVRSGRIVLHIKDGEYARVNNELHPLTGDQVGHNWRHLGISGYQPIPTESMTMLSKPTLFEISESGKVSSVRMSEEEAEWSINFKKALVALFQTGVGEASGARPVTSSGRPTYTSPMMWTAYEQAPDGECETKYEMVEVPASVAGTASEEVGELSIPKVEYCQPSGKIYQLTKTRNLDNCVRTAVFNFYKPGHLTCMPHEMRGVPMTSWKQAPYSLASGSCGSLWTRSSVTRYAVCGTPDHFLIQSIVNEGELNQHLMDYKTEKMLTGSRQHIKLISKQSSPVSEESFLTSSGPTVELSSLLYSYSKKTRSGIRMESGGPETVHEIMQEIKGNGERVTPEELIRKVVSLVKEVIQHDLLNPTTLPESEMSWKVLILSNTFKMFDRTMLRRVYETVMSSCSNEKDLARNILVDTIVMSGTPEAVKFFKHLAERGELRSSQISSIFFALPRTIVTPTSYLLEELFELVKSEPIKRETYVWNTAIL